MRRILPGISKLIVVFSLILFWSCTKIDTTTLGKDLIPAVDNVNTFADTIAIETTQGIFTDTFTRVGAADYHPLGTISNDPVFGKTTSDVYLQLKPNYYPYFYGITGDTIEDFVTPALGPKGTGFDSVVLCLSFQSFYGDTNVPQTLQVYKIDNNTTNFLKDSSYKLDFTPDQTAGEQLIGSTTILPTSLSAYTHFPSTKVRDSVNYQIRIKLDQNFLQSLIGLNRDTSAAAAGPFRSDSLFLTKFKGFVVKADGGQGNGLFYVNVQDAKTRLEIHYKKIRNNVKDTAYSSFYFSTGVTSAVSAHAVNLKRERTGSEILSPDPNSVYIQTMPGSFAYLNIPTLSTLSNRIIHRAEIMVQQVPSSSPVDHMLLPPAYLYLDLVDTSYSGERFKPVYYDLNPSTPYDPDNSALFYPSGGIDFGYYGGFARRRDDGGIPRYYYTFNVSRGLQHIVTNGKYNFRFRLYAPVALRYYGYSIAYRNKIADGRVKVGGGTHPSYKMYMRVVYSKI